MSELLAKLERELTAVGVRGRLKRRILAEAEDHLRSDPDAVGRFGSPRRVAVEAARVAHPRMLLRSALAYAAVVALFVLPLYGIPENTLPPAPWSERPDYLTWKLYVAEAAWVLALGAAAAAVLLAWVRFPRPALAALFCSAIALGVAAGIGSVGTVQWTDAVPGSGSTLVLSLIATAVLGCAAAGALASADRVRRLARDLPS
ncbi:MAG TPA: hypothetical protein VFT86_11070 [Gaiellaceae bacterium]|nr:hypothetical protein [Gaiellaceae bacterium]